MTIHWKAVEQYFTVVLFVLQFYLVFFLELALSEVKRLKYTGGRFLCMTWQVYLEDWTGLWLRTPQDKISLFHVVPTKNWKPAL